MGFPVCFLFAKGGCAGKASRGALGERETGGWGAFGQPVVVGRLLGAEKGASSLLRRLRPDEMSSIVPS